MSEKYGAKFREIYNRETNKIREVWSPVIYENNMKEIFVAEKGEILEFKTKEEAYIEAKQTYDKFKGKLWD